MLFFTKMRYNTEVKHSKLWGKNVVATSQRKTFPLSPLFPVRGGAPRRGDKFIHTEVKDNETAAF